MLKEGFEQLVLICVKSKLVVYIYIACATHTLTVYIGLGDYLHSLDPTRQWDEHLQHILIFCSVHVKRNFAKKFPTHPLRHKIHELLWGCESKSKLYEHMDSICVTYPELRHWVTNKKVSWLISGLTKAESKIDPTWWEYARKHTGVGESSHYQDNNFTGKKTTLLNAVLKCAYVQHM